MPLIRALQIIRARLSCLRDAIAYYRSIGVRIGEGCEVNSADIHLFGSEPYLVWIGDGVTISNDCQFVTHDGGLRVVRDAHPDAFYYAPITVGDQAFIGAGTKVLPGASIGARAVIGAGAIVAGHIPPETVAVGVPARPVKKIEDYALARREQWIDTASTSPEEKRRRILGRLADTWPPRD